MWAAGSFKQFIIQFLQLKHTSLISKAMKKTIIFIKSPGRKGIIYYQEINQLIFFPFNVHKATRKGNLCVRKHSDLPEFILDQNSFHCPVF